jgi:microcystin-dependent protein
MTVSASPVDATRSARAAFRRRLLPAIALAAMTLLPMAAQAQQQYLGEIRCFGFNFLPVGWLAADGSLLPISQNTALFSLLGTMYGGDGQTNFALPDLRGRSIVAAGNGPGLSPMGVGDHAGSETLSLSLANLPPHAHTVAPPASNNDASAISPAGNVPATKARTTLYAQPSNLTNEAPYSTSVAGSGQPAPIRSPYLAMTCGIAISGIYPSRN